MVNEKTSSPRRKHSTAKDPLARLSELIVELETGSTAGFSHIKAGQLARRLAAVASSVDPVRRPTFTFDPADPVIVGRFIAMMLAAQPQSPFGDLEKFYGSGVYAIYYSGPFPLYKPLSRSQHPIYVGKAVSGDEKASNPIAQGTTLWARLSEHMKSINKASSTLKISDFACRFLVVASGYESAAESYLIRMFRPIWNTEMRLCYGIGKHGDTATTRTNGRSPWDTIHPGRPWAGKTLADQKSPARISTELSDHFRKHKPYRSLDAILKHCLLESRQLPK